MTSSRGPASDSEGSGVPSSAPLIGVVAAGSFVAGFGVAELTGVRAIGGVVLLAGGAACAAMALPVAGPVRTGALLVLAFALFVASHPLGRVIGPWPAVLTTAAVAGAASAALARRAH